MKKIIILNYSKNNVKLFKTTFVNHMAYADVWNWDYLTLQRPYKPYPDLEQIKFLLLEYDIVMTVGSDCVFTNFSRDISQYATNVINVVEEGGIADTIVNGEIIMFRNMHDGRSMDYITDTQKAEISATGYKKDWGYQQVLNEHVHDWCFLNVIPATERIQGFPPERQNGNNWQEGDLIFHALGGVGDVNEWKRNIILDFVKKQYGQLTS